MRLLATAATLTCVLAVLPGSATAKTGKPFDFEVSAPAPLATASAAGGRVLSQRISTAHRFNLVGMRWRGRRRARDRGAGPPQPRRLEPLAAARRPRRPQPGPRLARARRGLLRPALGGLRRRRPVPPQPACRGAAAPLRERRPLRAPAAAHRPGARARLRQPLRVGRESVQATREAALRQRQGGDRPPHGLAERLHPRRRAGDRARDLPLPPQLQRLERHRLQRARRQVRRPLRGPRRRPRPRRRRRPGAGLQLGDGRDRQHRGPHDPGAHARDARRDRALRTLEARRPPPTAHRQRHPDERGRTREPLRRRRQGARPARARAPRHGPDRLPRAT